MLIITQVLVNVVSVSSIQQTLSRQKFKIRQLVQKRSIGVTDSKSKVVFHPSIGEPKLIHSGADIMLFHVDKTFFRGVALFTKSSVYNLNCTNHVNRMQRKACFIGDISHPIPSHLTQKNQKHGIKPAISGLVIQQSGILIFLFTETEYQEFL